ncbi:MAG: type II secretion system protein GspE, partial [Planctomycetota bacterium]|nr:type II secretion system protein GspE [Planctomycetota bacterium]
SLVACLAQRLVRKICPHCKVEYEPTPNITHALAKFGHEVKTLYRGEGCPKCHGSGLSGRIGTYELFVPNDEIRQAISDDAPLQELRALAKKNKMTTLYMDGLEKVRTGITTPEEVFRVCAG